MAKKDKKHLSTDENHLADHSFSIAAFPTIDAILADFRKPAFLNLTLRKRFKQINQTLYQLIKESPSPTFLLSHILDYFVRVNQEKILQDPLNFASFEFWLNNFSDVSEKENYEIRAKIVGKYIPREEYQVFFPIGMGKVYSGTHFVTAHLSPDVDTMIASFSGWLDAFGARVANSLHLWCLPGGPPDSPITTVLRELFGAGLFQNSARVTPALTLTAMDLVSQKKLRKELGHTIVTTLHHGSEDLAVILVNEQGHYLGDWRSSDAEIVRQISILFKSCLHWFENNLHTHLISLFAKEDLSTKDLPDFNASIFDIRIRDCEPARDFNENQKCSLNHFFVKVMGVKNGLDGTFRHLNDALNNMGLTRMLDFQKEVEALPTSDIFDRAGCLNDDRPTIFNRLKELIKHLDEAIYTVRNYVERLDIVLQIKSKVLSLPSDYITLRSDVDEMRQKMQNYDYLTVVIQEDDGSLFPVGIVSDKDLQKNGLGTVTLRDFCNHEEVRMASYLDVISVVDHHKSSLKTLSVPTALIGDAQSCNVLIAEQTFAINDKYSLGGLTPKQIESQIQEISADLKTTSQMRILRRLLQRRMIAHQKDIFFIHPEREYREYLCFLHAILDDTDLLTKVSIRDIECTAQLLNRLKSLEESKEVEIIDFDDIPRGKEFVKTAAKRILLQEDMYAIYKKTYCFREAEVAANLELCLKGHESNIFVDTKEQNGCARIGQTKLFVSNFPLFHANAPAIRQIWIDKSFEIFQEKPEIDLYLHMISTIASADEVYRNQIGPYRHQDELWIWTPPVQQGYDHLNSFLAGFQNSLKDFYDQLSIEFTGTSTQEFVNILTHHFPDVPTTRATQPSSIPMAVLRFKAGALNSRKAMVSPYLPRLV